MRENNKDQFVGKQEFLVLLFLNYFNFLIFLCSDNFGYLCLVIVPLRYGAAISKASIYWHPSHPLLLTPSSYSCSSLTASCRLMLGPLVLSFYFFFEDWPFPRWVPVLLDHSTSTMLLRSPGLTLGQVARPNTSGNSCRAGVWNGSLGSFILELPMAKETISFSSDQYVH